MDTKILEKLIKDHLGVPADKFFNEGYKEKNLQIVANQCTRLESELKAVREQKGKSAFFDRFEDVLNDLSFKSGHPEISYRDHEMARHAATALYLQRIAFWSDIIEEYRQAGEQIIEEAEKEAMSRIEKWKADNSLILEELNDKELIRKERDKALEEYQRMPWGKNCHYTDANRNHLIEYLASLQFQYLNGLNKTDASIYQKGNIRRSCTKYLQIKYLSSLLIPGGQDLEKWGDILMHPETYEKRIKELLPRNDHRHYTNHSVAMADALVKKGILKGSVTADNAARIIGRLYFDKELPKQLGTRARTGPKYKERQKRYFDNL
jgi:hypothetical protein